VTASRATMLKPTFGFNGRRNSVCNTFSDAFFDDCCEIRRSRRSALPCASANLPKEASH
jgi:hypothetical protein